MRRRRTGWLMRTFGVVLVLTVIALIFRQGWIPARYTPLPQLSLDYQIPFFVDWQIEELRFDRRLCKSVISRSPKLVAVQVPDQPFKDGCGWRNAVRPVRFGEATFTAARMTCPVAAAMALWIDNVVQPEAKRIFGHTVARIENMGVYSCRNVIGSRFWQNMRSEHASANAVDVGGFRLANGVHISVKSDRKTTGKKAEFLRAVHRGACRYFRVSLSPDYNAAHYNHFHFDRGILYTCR